MRNFLCLLALLATLPVVRSQTKNFIDQPYLETAAEVDTLVTPDRIFLEIHLQESDTKGRTSLEELEKRMASRLRAMGIDLQEQLTVSDLSSDFGKYFLRKQEVLKEKHFVLLVFDAPTAGRVLFELEREGISNVRLQRTEYAAMDTLRDTLLGRAVRRARAQGQIMAGALGQSLGKALYLSDSGLSVRNPMESQAPRAMMAADAPESVYISLPSDFDKIQVQVRVQVKFVLQ